jgi:hypothetical protein
MDVADQGKTRQDREDRRGQRDSKGVVLDWCKNKKIQSMSLAYIFAGRPHVRMDDPLPTSYMTQNVVMVQPCVGDLVDLPVVQSKAEVYMYY